MAGESETFSTAVIHSDDDNVKFGFDRTEMYQKNLAGTVNPYERHVFLCYKSHESWPSNVEDSESDPLPKMLAAAIKARRDDINVKTRLTICEGIDDVSSDGDVLIFPEMAAYRGLKEKDVDTFVEDVLVNGKMWVHGEQDKLIGSFVFVCAHNQRDKRCGVCGPILIEKFKKEIESTDLKNRVFVSACSHVGGHKYAGNIIIFSKNPEGKIAGNWYGYVTPDDVVELIDQQIGKGDVIERIWRGQMGANLKETEEVAEPKLLNGTSNVHNNANQSNEIIPEENIESVASCCQGASGFSCCRDENFVQKPVNTEWEIASYWTGKWEKNNHILTTVAVAGAVATVAVAYAFYRRAR